MALLHSKVLPLSLQFLPLPQHLGHEKCEDSGKETTNLSAREEREQLERR